MFSSRPHHGAIPGTVGAFNFIRRIAFPSTVEVLSIFCALATFSATVSFPAAGFDLRAAVWFALLVIIGPVILGEFLNALVILRREPVLDFRRLIGMELVSWSPILIVLPLSATLTIIQSKTRLVEDGLFLSLALSIPARTLGLFAISQLQTWKKALGTIIVPAASVRGYNLLPLVGIPTSETITKELLILITGIATSAVAVSWMMTSIEKTGSASIGGSPMALFRAFLQHWLKRERGPLEQRLEPLGRQERVDTSILAFYAQEGKPKACIVASGIHPGPYRDLGSGGLPSTLKAAIETSVGGVALVPHGISNHEFNIVSQEGVRNVVKDALARYPTAEASNTASRFIREEFEGAKASAQAFGNVVLLTLTMAPDDMEDIPVQVLEAIRFAATGEHLVPVALDAHNSLSGQTAITSEQAQKLTEAALRALVSISTAPQASYRVGAACYQLNEFSLEEGIGPGGVAVLVIETRGQLSAYATIDGNNMQPGLRDVIIRVLKDEGVEEAEVLTTDTHLVAGLVSSPLGYHPVGEGLDKPLLIGKVRETLRAALRSLEQGSAGFSSFTSTATVMGSQAFGSITLFIGRVAARISRFFFRLELATLILTIVLLTLL